MAKTFGHFSIKIFIWHFRRGQNLKTVKGTTARELKYLETQKNH